MRPAACEPSRLLPDQRPLAAHAPPVEEHHGTRRERRRPEAERVHDHGTARRRTSNCSPVLVSVLLSFVSNYSPVVGRPHARRDLGTATCSYSCMRS